MASYRRSFCFCSHAELKCAQLFVSALMFYVELMNSLFIPGLLRRTCRGGVGGGVKRQSLSQLVVFVALNRPVQIQNLIVHVLHDFIVDLLHNKNPG